MSKQPPVQWPKALDVYAALRPRLEAVLAAQGELVAELARRALASGGRGLSDQPRSPVTLVVVGCCLSAGRDWRAALWPAVGMDCIMAAADLLDDVADGEMDAYEGLSPGVVLTCAAGLLAAAGGVVLRAVEDGVPAQTAVALGQIVAAEFARAANGQARSLHAAVPAGDAVAAYQASSAKSGPFGSLAGRLGARVATEDADLLDLYGRYGWRSAVFGQLTNDAVDAAPGASVHKRDVVVGAQTVPLVFSGSAGAPAGLQGAELAAWEEQERERIAAAGGVTVAYALAQAERLRAIEVLDTLAARGHSVDGLRALLH